MISIEDAEVVAPHSPTRALAVIRRRNVDKAPRIAGMERCVSIELRPLGGVEVRPTRLFFWLGSGRRALRIVPLAEAPRLLRRGRRPRSVRLGPIHASTLGNPVVTLASAGVRAAARATRTP